MRRYARSADGNREGLAYGDPVPRGQLPVLLAERVLGNRLVI
jgi:hypothetical protein